MLKLKLTSMHCLLLMVLLLILGTSSSIAANMQVYPDDGLKNTKIEWFNTLRFFNGMKNAGELNQEVVDEYRKKIDKILDAGNTPIGAINSWSFPEFSHAPKVKGTEVFMGMPVARLDAIPPFTDPEYKRLEKIRSQMYESIVTEFPEIDTWLIGYEGDYIFKNMDGTDLSLDSYITFLLDASRCLMQIIREENPDAVLICHYLGRWGKLMKISGEPVQPREILELISPEIKRRGEAESLYYSQLITDLIPSLAEDREVDIPSQEYGLRSYGWNTKWYDTFPLNTMNLTNTSSYWDDVRSSVTTMVDVVVAGGKARCYLEDVNGYVGAGAKSTNLVTVVPSASQLDDNWSLKDYWTGYMEIDPLNRTQGDTFEHAGTFIRVNDRTWNNNLDQTRFGTIAFTANRNESGLGSAGCSGGPCAALQFTSDASPGNGSVTFFAFFPLDEQPFIDTSSTIWTLQIYERKRLKIDYTYELEWKGEVVKGATEMGSSGWITSTTILNACWTDPDTQIDYYMEDIPELNGSKYIFGITGEDNAIGRMNVDYTATAWWEW